MKDEWVDEHLGGIEIVSEPDRQIALQIMRHFISEYGKQGDCNGWDKKVYRYLPLIAPKNLVKLAKHYGWPLTNNEGGEWIPWEQALERARAWQDKHMT